MTREVPDIDGLDFERMLATQEPLAGVPLPSEGPHVVIERVRLPLDTYQRLEEQARRLGVEPHELVTQFVEAMIPAMQQLIDQQAHRTPPAA